MTTRRLACVALSALLALGCERESASPTPDAGSSTPFSEIPFPALGPSDYEVDARVGFPLAKRHLLVAFNERATEAGAQQLIAASGATLVGALGAARIVMIRLPEGTTTAARLALVTRLQQDPTVASVTEDLLLGPTYLPPHPQAMDPAWDWSNLNASAGTHAVRAMGMPIAWNLKPRLEAMAAQRRVRVGVIDVAFKRHADLDGVLTILSGAFPDNHEMNHATAVAGIIGASWNGRFTDGLSPWVSIYGAGFETPLPSLWTWLTTSDVSTLPASFAQGLASAWTLVRTQRPRLVNLSLGFNFYDTCYAAAPPLTNGRRCDPRQGSTRWGVAAADSSCDGETVRNRIVSSGMVFHQLVNAANATSPVMFFAAAGNDSGPSNGDNWCAARPPRAHGLGLFPAELASPFTAAGITHRNPHVIVVEAVRPNLDMRGGVSRAFYSNVGGHLLAPGDGVSTLAGGGGESTYLRGFNGTSSATPHATGAAAWLLALNPRLTNAELRALLLSHEGDPIADTPTRARLYLPSAIGRMSVDLGDGVTANGASLLADMDDGTPLGFSVRRFDDNGALLGLHDAPRVYSDTHVGMPDFRYLRNSALVQAGLPGPMCASGSRTCDLNHNGRFTTQIEGERHGLAELVQLPLDDTTVAASMNLAALMRAWQGSMHQTNWRADELPGLLNSADYEVFAGEFLRRTGAEAVVVTLDGAATPNGPARRDPYTEVRVEAARTILTAPVRMSVQVQVRVVGGMHAGRTISAQLPGIIQPGQHVPLVLNPCALEPGALVGLLDPFNPSCMPGSDGGAPTDASIPDAGPPPPSSCQDLERGTEPYVCFTLSGGPLPTSYNVRYGWVPPAAFSGYFNSATGRSLLRMTWRIRVNGADEQVNVELTVPGNGAGAESWRPDVVGSGPTITFSDPAITTGSSVVREFVPHSVMSGMSLGGSTAINRFGAPGAMIEGTFSGAGAVMQRRPTEEDFEPVTLNGSFRVPRTPDR